MGYLHINNLYKDQTILMFKQCYALEKIHGTSAHISWKTDNKKLILFSGGERYENFVKLFSTDFLYDKFSNIYKGTDITIYGEAYGGKQQGMKDTYGSDLKFIGFDVRIDGKWLNVPKAEAVCRLFGIEFVSYSMINTDLENVTKERDRPSVQAFRNGCGMDKKSEGIVLRPLVEMFTIDGERVIAKYKREDFRETKKERSLNKDQIILLEEAKAIAEEWVTEQRLNHVLDKLPQDTGLESMRTVIDAMIEDIYREAKGEIIESRAGKMAIGKLTARLFKRRIQI